MDDDASHGSGRDSEQAVDGEEEAAPSVDGGYHLTNTETAMRRSQGAGSGVPAY
jgi:hypothetical protein